MIRYKHIDRLLALAYDMFLVYVVYAVCRLVFILHNYQLSIVNCQFIKGTLMFDTSAILYTNSLFMLLVLFPLHWKEKGLYHAVLRWIYVIVNSVCVVANMVDVVYFPYTGRRTTVSMLRQLSDVDNLAGIIWTECMSHWWLVAITAALVAMFAMCYVKPVTRINNHLYYYIKGVLSLLIVIPLSIIAMRGGLSSGTKPITVVHALQYASRPSYAAAIVNTPFAFIRTADKFSFRNPRYLPPAEADALYSPVHRFSNATAKRKNVVLIVLESFGKEYIGAYNSYEGYTPFLDSLISKSLTFRYSFANGRVSMDGIPAILSGIPMFEESFFLTDASLNRISGIAGELGRIGYSSAFFHGASNGSMGFSAYARASGFQSYYGMDEFCEDVRFNGKDEFDGKWAIWDEPFMQYSALRLSDLKPPFVATIYTATSHHPYVLPVKYGNVFPEEQLPIHKCIRYTDYSLRGFFSRISREPWYRNTLFVITADHTNQSCQPKYQTDLGKYEIPIIFYDPQGEISAGFSGIVAQQTDIMPTVLSYLGYDGEFLSYGKNLFAENSEGWYVGFNNGVYQYVEDDRLLQFDGTKTIATYDYQTDSLLQDNLLDDADSTWREMEIHLKAIIQSYMIRMETDGLAP